MSAKTYTANVLHGAKDMRIETRDIPKADAGNAVVRLVATGLCGSDLHYYTHGRNGAFILQSPLVLGHEAGGEIVDLPPNYSGELKVGDRVAVEAGVNCKKCRYCKAGTYNLCVSMEFCSSAKTFPHRDGTLQEFMLHPTEFLYKLADNVTFEQASLAEPLSVIIQATRRSRCPEPGSSVLVLGAGAVGLLACAMAKTLGATRVVAVDIDEGKLDFAKAEGWADETLVLPRGPRVSGKESLEAAKALVPFFEEKLGKEGFDSVFECTGVESCMQVGILLAKTGGKVIYVGMGTPEAMLPTANAFTREVDLMGVFRYNNTYPTALALLASGRLGPGLSKMVSQRYPLDRAEQAFVDVARGRDETGKGVIKVMIGPDYKYEVGEGVGAGKGADGVGAVGGCC